MFTPHCSGCRNDSVEAAFVLGATFGSLSKYVGDKVTNYANRVYIGGTTINPNVSILLQNYGRPIPYPDLIGTGGGAVVSGVQSFIPLPVASTEPPK